MKRIKVGIAVLCIVAVAAGVWGVTASRGQGGGTADLEHSMETLNGLLLSADGMLEEHYKNISASMPDSIIREIPWSLTWSR